MAGYFHLLKKIIICKRIASKVTCRQKRIKSPRTRQMKKEQNKTNPESTQRLIHYAFETWTKQKMKLGCFQRRARYVLWINEGFRENTITRRVTHVNVSSSRFTVVQNIKFLDEIKSVYLHAKLLDDSRFTDNFFHLHYNRIESRLEAISGNPR